MILVCSASRKWGMFQLLCFLKKGFNYDEFGSMSCQLKILQVV